MEQEDSSRKKKASLKRKLPSESAPEKKRKSREGSKQNGLGEGDEEDSAPEEHPQKKAKKTKKKQKTDQRESASLDEETLRLPLTSTDGLLKTSKQFYAAKDKIDHVEEDVDNEDKIPLAVKSRKYLPTKGFSLLCLSLHSSAYSHTVITQRWQTRTTLG